MDASSKLNIESLQEAASILNVGIDADEAEVRAAYIEQIKAHPPDADPEAFERIRDAYELMSDPQLRMQHRMFAVDPAVPLVELLEDVNYRRRFLGPKPWLEALGEKAKV